MTRIKQAIIDAIRPPEQPLTPSYVAMMAALDALEYAGGDGKLGPDGRLYAGGDVLDHPAVAYLEAIMRGWLDVQFGRRLVLTTLGRQAVIKARWTKPPEPQYEPLPYCKEMEDFLFGPPL